MVDEVMSDAASPASGTGSDTGDSDDEQVELLVTGRERRKTAGNRYQREQVQEEGEGIDEEDEVALLFAGEQDEVDEEFKSAASDDDDMSSSDDDDQGPNAAGDDADGERELQKQAKVERAQKRKAKDALTSTAALRKRPRIDPTAPKLGPKKPSKKKERVTWLPDLNNTGGRSSLRKQTIQHRATTIARLKESEAQSKITRKIREQRDKERALTAAKPMTQDDRLAEAARVERQNSKSLNRWEETERRRNDEQAARLAALKDRKLEGPVISWRSRRAKFSGPKYPPAATASELTIDDGPKKKGRKTKAYHEEMARMRGTEMIKTEESSPATVSQPSHLAVNGHGGLSSSLTASTSSPFSSGPQQPHGVLLQPTNIPQPQIQAQQSTVTVMGPATSGESGVQPRPNDGDTNISDRNHKPMGLAAPPAGDSFLSGIFDYANLEGDERPAASSDTSVAAAAAPPPAAENGSPAAANEATGAASTAAPTLPEPNSDVPMSGMEQATTENAAVPPTTAAPTTASGLASESQPAESASLQHPDQKPPLPPAQARRPLIEVLPDQPTSTTKLPQPAPDPPTPASPEIEMEEGSMTRNLVCLNDFDDLSPTLHHEYSVFFNTKKTAKPVRHKADICPITQLPARYRDPSTGIGYANLHACRTLKELKEHKFMWSSMLGCYVGRDGGVIARGCVEGFLKKASPVGLS